MLTVQSVSPAINSTGIFRDVVIRIRFSEELNSASVAGEFFKLYIQPNWSGTIGLSITKDPTDHNTIILVPTRNLSPNTQYAIWVMGDKNTADTDLQGVVSIPGNVLDDHYISYFTTGDKLSTTDDIDKQIGGYDPIPGGSPGSPTGVITPDEHQAILDSNQIVDVVRTNPSNGQAQVSGLVNMSVTFDQAIVSYGDSYEDIMKIEAYPYIFGSTPVLPTITDITPSGSKLQITTDGAYSQNTEYTVTVYREAVSGLPMGDMQEGLPIDVTFTFSSDIYPACTDARTIRHRAGTLIPPDVPDTTINRYILDATIWAANLIGVTPSGQNICFPGLNELIICKVLYDMAIGIGEGSLYGIKEKRLADLRIVYDTDGLKRKMRDLEECIDSALMGLGLGSKIQRGVKSINATERPYVGAKRHILKYDARHNLRRRQLNKRW